MIIVLCLTLLMLLVIALDASRYLIPNWLVGMVLALYPIMIFALHVPVDWKTALIVMAAAFAVGYIIFSLRWMGGGDVKLLTACCLWTGLAALPDFLVLTAILGGVLSLFLLFVRPVLLKIPRVFAYEEKLPRILKKNAPVPYGLAIASAFLIVLWQHKLPGVGF